jgi:hypothetical protein
VSGGKHIDIRIEDQVPISDSISASVSKSIVVPKKAYAAAVERLALASADQGLADEAFAALAEATNWLVSLTDQTDLAGDMDVQAVTFARNRAHHHWASVAYFDKERDALMWRPATQLPVPQNERFRDEKRQPVYEERLSQRPVLEVFERLRAIVAKAAPR